MKDPLLDIYNRLLQRFGPQNWWPADSPFEVIIGAILTQNTNWGNVEKAVANLRHAKALSLNSINQLPAHELEALIRPSGFFRQKSVRLQNFTSFVLNTYDGDLDKLFALPLKEMRNSLLEQPGIGPETADSVILYAANKPSFVVDAYTQRIFSRLGILPDKPDYDVTRSLFMTNLPPQVELFNEYHALIVRLAKICCQKRAPRCPDCPLLEICRHGQTVAGD